MKKMLLSLVFALSVIGQANGQVKLDGDTKAQSGDFIRIKVTQSEGKDLKIICVPENNNWEAVRNIDNNILILFSPKKTEYDTTYYFFAAINSNDKTYTAIHSIMIQGTGNKKPDPIVPETNELTKRLDGHYLVSPNAKQLDNYIKVFVALDKMNDSGAYKTYKEAWDTLVSSTKELLNSDTDLRALRDEIGTYLVEYTGRDSTKYDKDKLSQALKGLVKALKQIQDNRR